MWALCDRRRSESDGGQPEHLDGQPRLEYFDRDEGQTSFGHADEVRPDAVIEAIAPQAVESLGTDM